MLFTDFWLKKWLLRGLDEMWYHQATPIQEKVIRMVLSGNNVVWQSQTWTGKTAAFLVPLLNKIDTNQTLLQVLIIAPTRELVHQIWEEIRNLTKYYRIRTACLFGWASMINQTIELRRSPSIIVATPWRLMDFMRQGLVKLDSVEYFVLDEVDRMLDMGFVRDIRQIWSGMKWIKQTLTFSATLSSEVKKIINEHISSYEFIKIWEAITVDKINHSYIELAHDDKFITCKQLIDAHPKDKILVFTHTKRNTKTIHKILEAEWYKVWLLNGDMKQSKRMSTLLAFKEQKIRIMVTTDVAARWLNMNNVWLVINFDVPQDAESYIHRIGRTWRAWASGKAIMLVSQEEKNLLANIEKVNRTKIKKSSHLATIDRGGNYSRVRLSKVKVKWEKKFSPPRWKYTSNESRSKFGERDAYPPKSKSRSYDDKPKFGERKDNYRDWNKNSKNKNFHSKRFHQN
jgi:ATP-dependent RNA helicase DeaD